MAFSCDICLKSYSEANNIPKVLNCGHTFCHVCVTDLISKKTFCPTCKKNLDTSIEMYPTNFLALRDMEQPEKGSCSDYHMECIVKKIEKDLVKRKDMLVKNIGERTNLKNLISNGITKLKQVSEMDADTRIKAEVDLLLVELEDYIEKTDEVMMCCNKLEMKQTYNLKDYTSTSFFLYELANRLHKGEDLYAYEIFQNSRPKYGKVVLVNDRINIHPLTLSKIDKLSSRVSFEDLRKCITSDMAGKFRTFLKIGEETLSFSIIDSSFLALRFVKLCSGEDGPTFKGATFVTPKNINTYDLYGLTTKRLQEEYVSIEKYILNDVETEGFEEYDLSIFCAEKETKCSAGEIVVQMNLNGSCEIRKCLTDDFTCKNVVAKLTEPCDITLVEINPDVIKDCGISLII